MRFSLAAAVLPVLAASVSAQTTIQVQVGASNGLTYTPERCVFIIIARDRLLISLLFLA